MQSNVVPIEGGKLSKAARKEVREIYKEQLKPVIDQAKLDVTAVQNDMIFQLVNMPFRKRLRFCYGILLEGRFKEWRKLSIK